MSSSEVHDAATDVSVTPLPEAIAPIFEFNAGAENGGVIRFPTVESVNEWVNDEINAWLWLDQATGNAEFDAPRNKQRLAFKQMRRTREALVQQAPDSIVPGSFSAFESILRQHFETNGAVYSKSTRAHFLNQLAAADPKLAVQALGQFLGTELQTIPISASAIEGRFLALQFEKGIAGRADAELVSVLDLKTQLSSSLGELQRGAQSLLDNYSETSTKLADLAESQRRAFDDAEGKRSNDFSTLCSKSEAALGNIEVAFTKHMALKEPVQYLNDRSRTHLIVACVFGGLCLLAAGGLVLLAWLLADDLFSSELPDWAKISVGALSVTLSVWLLRVLLRICLGNLHLRTDLVGRATMLTAYLALLKEGGAMKDDDRELILRVLFRPTSDGIVRDDAAPAGPWDLATRALNPR